MATVSLPQPPIFIQQGAYSARLTRNIVDLLGTEGIIGAGDFAASERAAAPAMQVDVAAGRALVDGDDIPNQYTYLAVSEGLVEVPVAAADTVDDRIDLLVLRVLDSDAGVVGEEARVELITGVPDPSPVAPALPPTAIALAEVLVQANVIAILDTDITDVRSRARTFDNLPLGDLADVDLTGAADGEALVLRNGEWVADVPDLTLGDLTDVDTSGAVNGRTLVFEDGEWITTAPPTAPDLGDLGDVDTTGVGDGDVLAFNNTSGKWEPDDEVVRSEDVSTIVALTQAQYDAIPSPDPATLYVITD